MVVAEQIRQSLEGRGLRCTPQRYAVMAFLLEHNSHPTAVEIFEAVNRLDPAFLTGPLRTTICAIWCRPAWFEKSPLRGGRHALTRKVFVTTISSAIVAGRSKISNGRTFQHPPPQASETAFCASLNSSFAVSAPSALQVPARRHFYPTLTPVQSN